MNEELEESPYCEVCGHCGEIGCCGIVGFLEEHVEDKTNCKNECWIIQEIKDICKYENEVFKENDALNKGIDNLIKKYENKIIDLKGFKKEDRYLLKQQNNYYEQIIQDLKSLKGE